MRRAIQTLIVVATLAATHAVRADTVTIGVSKDNTLYENLTGSTSDGLGPYVRTGTAGADSQRRGVMAFDIAGNIPAGATITSVQLQLNVRQVSLQWPGPTDATLHRLSADWGEGVSNAGFNGNGAPSEPNDATWIHRSFSTVLWTAAGGDFAAVPSATATVPGISMVTWESTPEMVSDVQSWLDTPANNFGWILLGDETQARTAFYFDSLQNQDDPSSPPELTVQFTPPVPAVSGWGMVVLSGLVVAAGMVIVKRRRQAMA